MTRIEMVRSGRFALLRITEPDRIKLEKHLFRRYPELEWGSFLRFGFRRTSWGLASCFVDAIWPEPGELDRQSPITTFNSEYTLRAFRAAQAKAARHGHQQVDVEHLLAALLEQEGGLAASILTRARIRL